MKMAADDGWVDEQIARELALLTDDIVTKDADFILEDADSVTEDPEIVTEITDDIDVVLKDYVAHSSKVVDSIKDQLNDVDSILSEKVSKKVVDYDEELKAAAKSRGLDVAAFSDQILAALDQEDQKDDLQEETVTEHQNELDSVTGALVEFCEADELEQNFRKQMHEWSQKQKDKDSARTVAIEHDFHQIKERLNILEIQRQNLLESMKREEISLEEMRTLRLAELEMESAEADKVLRMEQVRHEEALMRMANERGSQERYIHELKSQAEAVDRWRKHTAATKIQSLWRGYQARQEYGETVNEWIQHGKRKREEKRVREIENERIKKATEERIIKEEEEKKLRQLEMERLKEEERLRKEEKDRLRRLEEEKIEAEKKRKREEEREIYLEQERKRMLEEEKKAKEAARLEEEKRIKEEAWKKAEEERLEQEKKEELEHQKKLTEEKRKADMDRLEEEKRKLERLQRMEEERLCHEEHLKRQKEELEKKEREEKIEAERLRKLEEKRKLDEEERLADERKKEEERQKAELEKRRLEEEKILEEMAKEKFKSKFGVYNSPPTSSDTLNEQKPEEDSPCLEKIIQNSRLSWMQSCIPLSKILMEAKSRKIRQSTIPKRRPSSSKKLTILPDKYIFTDGLSDSYEEIHSVKLDNLPVYSLQPLASCLNLTIVTISDCQIIVMDAFEKCLNLRMFTCRNSKVEVVNLRNSCHLVHVDLSENQLSTIHGLDGCTNLRYLNLSKNRITRIENLCFLKLHTLILSHNSITRTTNISESPGIQIMNLARNNIRKCTELEKLPLLSDLDLSYNSLESMPHLTNHVLLQNLNLECNGLVNIDGLSVYWLPLLQRLNLSKNSVMSMPKLHSPISLISLNIAENSISEFKPFLSSITRCERLEEVNLSGNPVTELTPNLRDLVKSALPWLRNINGFSVESKHGRITSTDFIDLCASHVDAKMKLESTYAKKMKEIIDSEPELLPNVHEVYYDKSSQMASDFRYAHEYGDTSGSLPDDNFFTFEVSSMSLRSDTPKNVTPDLNTLSQTNVTNARSKFEMALGSKQDVVLKEDPEKKSSTDRLTAPMIREKSALKIQSVWRSYACRKRIVAALDFTADDDAEFGNFDEIDIDAFDADAALLDRDWLPPSDPDLPSAPILAPIPPGPPKEAWAHLKPPQSPALLSDLDTTRTKASKSEQLSEEWGFKDSKTADMMLKRAKKLKYDALRRKRLAQLDPKQRLILMRKLEESTHLPTVQPPKRGSQRKDYFRAKEEDRERERLERAAERHNKMQRMYEWVHTAVVDPDTQRSEVVAHKPPPGLRAHWATSEGSLPKLSHKPPGSDVSSISLQSVESGRRYSYDGVPRTPPFPPIKNNSAPSAHRKSSNPELAWGGGKKRNGKR